MGGAMLGYISKYCASISIRDVSYQLAAPMVNSSSPPLMMSECMM